MSFLRTTKLQLFFYFIFFCWFVPYWNQNKTLIYLVNQINKNCFKVIVFVVVFFLLLALAVAQFPYQALMVRQDQIAYSHQTHPKDRAVMAKEKQLQAQNRNCIRWGT